MSFNSTDNAKSRDIQSFLIFPNALLLTSVIFLPENPRVVFKSESRVGYSLTVFENHIYAAFSLSHVVMRLDKTSGNNAVVFHSSRRTVREATVVFAYDSSRQPRDGLCANHDCEQLCLPYNETKYRCVLGYMHRNNRCIMK